MAADPMPQGDDTKPQSVLCEFCECKLTRRGQVIEISSKAKDLRKLQDKIDRLESSAAEQAETITRLERELAEAKAARKADDGDGDGDGDEDFFS